MYVYNTNCAKDLTRIIALVSHISFMREITMIIIPVRQMRKLRLGEVEC